ncbi:histidinol-phosphate transaminase [Halobacillus litoralis]|uniref:Histidinol-phosphate aminotransferase n=1 Tax=Halobacillus litoralis TaxID=45668 RepID=A0A845DZG5_9BACI|nr:MULTISPECIES: histidinol-phosphate transaminase [Halobacillus]MYL19417.1 histidinol-phosphate transaminase [Halobacillus litoralis]MYL28562.1 histidinol-phosphate transaminase [Halobacillus halophilus]
MKAKDILKSMKPYKPGKGIEEVKEEYGLDRIVKLASNENPYGFSPVVKEELPKLVSKLEIYPDGYAAAVRSKVSGFLGVDEEQIIFGNGSDEVVQIICRTFLEPGANTVMASPTFPQYRHNALIEGAEVREVPLKDGHHDLEEMIRQIDENTRVFWICTPNNPTGVHINEETIKDVLSRVPEHVLVVLDEAYYEYLEAEDSFDAVAALKQYPNLMVLRTFSKAYGLAGLRIGFGLAGADVIQVLEPAREPFNTSTVAQAAAILALDDQEFISTTVEANHRNKKALMRFCDENDLGYYDTQANFLLIQLPISGDEMFEYLLTQGFIVRSGEALGLPNSIRLTIGKEEDMKQIQQAMREKLEMVKQS